jgi:undecaprenyl-diphosphatase
MSPTTLQIIILAMIQGAAELLPVSSSAHVIVAEKLMGLRPASPEMMFLMIMLHTGTMMAVMVYFWKSWKSSFFADKATANDAVFRILIASAVTAVLTVLLKTIIENTLLRGRPGAAIEDLSDSLYLIAANLALVGALIVYAGLKSRPGSGISPSVAPADPVPPGPAIIVGAVQGLSLPFRGFSRSGATISTGMLLGIPRRAAEEFSFALAVVITPPIIAREYVRFHAARAAAQGSVHVGALVTPGLMGMVFSFLAGLLALKWLSGWLENGRWHYFGFYCFAAAAGVCALARMGY